MFSKEECRFSKMAKEVFDDLKVIYNEHKTLMF